MRLTDWCDICSDADSILVWRGEGRIQEELSTVASPLHQELPTEVVWASCWEASWSASWGGVLGMYNWRKGSRQAQRTLERSYHPAGTLGYPPRGAEKGPK